MYSSEDPVACSGFSRRTFFRFAAGASALGSVEGVGFGHQVGGAGAGFVEEGKSGAFVIPQAAAFEHAAGLTAQLQAVAAQRIECLGAW